MTSATTYQDVDALLAAARSQLRRLTPHQAAGAAAEGALIVDIRPAWQREQDGEIPGSVIIERNHLEWRLHPASDARIAQAAPDRRWVIVCSEGYASSLAAASLLTIGVPATDVEGGIRAWRRAGLPINDGPITDVEQVVPDGR